MSEDAIQRAVIDRSTKLPVLFFITSGVSWLLVSTLMGLIASIKVYAPGFLDSDWLFWLHYGRIQPAFTTAFIYGWGFNAAFAVMIWMMARLCRVPLRNPWTLITAGHVWNAGVLLGTIGILFGGNTSLEWLEFPDYVWVILIVAYSLIAVWMITMFRVRREKETYVSVWYLLGACLWFPWMFMTANLFLRGMGDGAVAASAINSWYTSNLVLLWFVPIGLASIYFIVPKISGRPIFNYQLATVGFWTLAALAGWTGFQKLMGGPLPMWMTGVSSGATMMILIPILTVAINHHYTVRGKHSLVESSPSLRFSFMAGIALTAWAVLNAFMASFEFGQFTQFTSAVEGANMLAIYGFFSMAMFGAIYFIVPRLVGCEWFSAKIIRQHFWFSVYGVASMVIVLVAGGVSQGDSIGTWDRGMVGSVEISRGWLIGRTVAWVFIVWSNLLFLMHLTLMILRLGRRSQQPTLLRDRLVSEGATGTPAEV
ncbi:MAG: cbb3-type cytochrome c oxidase subunit I [Verrucomicrobiales bacterium]|nr:cbb3-type cytochrome c oxidase subunit I [Verrucomicrobiales bacterium]